MRDDEAKVADIIEACEQIAQHIGGDHDRFRTDPVIQAAAQRWLEIIGEASARLSDEFKHMHAEVAWRDRLTVPVRVDVLDLRQMLHAGDLSGATETYTGQLLPDSEAPFAVDNRHVIDVALRRSLLESGTTSDLLRFAEVHRHDEAVLQRAVQLTGPSDPLHHEAKARLELALRP
ncbi:hypothetical protein BH23ACT2_BH23ACT2_07290 [soil metagenome]